MNLKLIKFSIISAIAVLIFSVYHYTNAAFKISRPPAAPNLKTGLVGYWTFDGKDINWATDTFYDKSGQGNNASSSLSMTNVKNVFPGKIGQSLKFGSSTYQKVNVANTTNLNPVVISVSAWIKPNGSGGGNGPMNIVDKGGNNGYRFRVDSSRTLSFFDRGGTNNISTTQTIPLDDWTHVVATGSSSGLKIYINGIFSTSNAVPYGSPNTSEPFNIGGAVFSEYFSGLIDEVRVYNRALSASEVKSLYNQGASKFNKTPTNTLTNGLVGYWTFDGADTNWSTNTVTDRSGNGNNGTMINMSTSTSPAPGKIGQALKFDGVNDYVNAGSQSSLDIEGTSPLTLSAWVKPSKTLPEYVNFVSKQNVGDAGYLLVVRNNGNYGFVLYNTGTDCSLGKNNLSPGEWYHMVGTYDGTTAKFYFNGVLISSAACQGSGSHSEQNLNIGYGGNYFPGLIDEVRIYNRALSASEVKTLYNMGR